MDELVECPVCGVFLDAGAEAEAHVAAHFAASQDAERAPSGRAAGAASPLAGSQPNGGTGLSVSLDAGVMCAECGAAVALAELDSHEEAHRCAGCGPSCGAFAMLLQLAFKGIGTHTDSTAWVGRTAWDACTACAACLLPGGLLLK